MSISYIIDVHCDKCGNWIRGPWSAKPNAVRRTLAQAKKAGWSRNVNPLET